MIKKISSGLAPQQRTNVPLRSTFLSTLRVSNCGIIPGGVTISNCSLHGPHASAVASSARARRTPTVAAATADSYSFEEDKFHRVQFVDEPYGPMKIYQDPRANVQFTGVMMFKRCLDSSTQNNLKVMEVFVAGDTAVNIYTLVNNQKLERPMVHDVMFSIMQQAQAGDPRRWGLLRVAIVGLQNDVFVGRLFFGDPLTQTVYWDCDCRPSDGCYLSIKTNAPLFINKTVWDAAAKSISDSTIHQMLLDGQLLHKKSPKEQNEEASIQPVAQQVSIADIEQSSTSHDYMTMMQDDLDAIKLLKRKLALAVREEDYKAASAIRDHPYMRLYKDMFNSKLQGKKDEAAHFETELKRQIEANMLKQDPTC